MRLYTYGPWAFGLGRDGFGYDMSRKSLFSGLQALGWEIGENDADTAIHVTAPFGFKATPGKRNVLYTMWELDEIPPQGLGDLEHADLVIVPSRYCREVISRYYRGRIEIVPLGVDPEVYSYKRRRLSRPFRFLWVGAPNPRKGWDVLLSLWDQTFINSRSCELYLKTTCDHEDQDVIREENRILDSRFLTKRDLVDLYHSAHAFILPHGGEGFGLTLAEAMATGLPCITTQVTGVLDFTNSHNVYYVGYDSAASQYEIRDEKIPCSARVARPHEIANAMERIIKHYDEALDVGKRASRTITRLFTWEAAARRLSCILTDFCAAKAA